MELAYRRLAQRYAANALVKYRPVPMADSTATVRIRVTVTGVAGMTPCSYPIRSNLTASIPRAPQINVFANSNLAAFRIECEFSLRSQETESAPDRTNVITDTMMALRINAPPILASPSR